ncbi:LOG family protein [Nocardioides daphniae]|uniref:LOG family protein n=1 Tax=Nocardioides daphniae TaxID=402297 RepID=UPI001EE9A658|nr:LOG family protein [Nocardioides daphniae]
MRRTRGRTVEVDSLRPRPPPGLRHRLPERLAGPRRRPDRRAAALAATDVTGALFLGCTFADGGDDDVRRRGAIVFPRLPDVPVEVYRSRLYTPQELLRHRRLPDLARDARAYAWAGSGVDPDLAASLHDHAIDEALGRLGRRTPPGRRDGGHSLQRGRPEYAYAAELGRALGRTHVVTTGGGPGAMEAANLGAYLAAAPREALVEALEVLGRAPSFTPDVGAWVGAAFDVLHEHPHGTDTLGIPTWHYGHEPPNPFATRIAKYFRNATREAILLEVCDSGIVFLPGAAGTLQEVFQDACENYYADESSIAPMVLVGREHWTETVPAWQLLTTLARGRAMESHVHLVDTVEEAAALVRSPDA